MDYSSLLQNPDQLDAILAANSFKEFVRLTWASAGIPNKFQATYLTNCLCEHLQAVYTGQIKRLVLACPIRHGKSLFTEVFFPAWLWVRNPALRILSASCGEDLAIRDSTRSRQIIQSPVFQQCFGHVFKLADDQNAKGLYSNDRGGHRRAVGVGTQSTGQDADVLLIDDLIDQKKAKSEAERRACLDQFTNVLSQRLVMMGGLDRIVVAGHRIGPDDLFNHIQETDGGEWTYLVLPAEAKPSITNGYYSPIGWKDTREEGELLSPEIFSADQLRDKKRSLRWEYNVLFQQDVKPRDGKLFKADWFRHYQDDGENYRLGEAVLPKRKAWRFATCDTAISTSEDADFTVMQVWDSLNGNLILVDQLREKLDGNRIVPKLAAFYRLHKPQFLCLEKEFVGRFVCDQLSKAGVLVKPFSAKHHGDKETRAIAAEIRLEAGKVWFPSNRDWVADLEGEILSFPNGARDDQVDCVSMSALMLDKYAGRYVPDPTPEELLEKARKDEEQRFHDILNSEPPLFRMTSPKYGYAK